MKKRPLFWLLAGTLLAGTVFGAFVVIYVWETTMAMKLMGDYSIELQYTNGTAITTYDWGLFSVGQTKSLRANIVNVGDVPVNMTWNTNLNSTAWSLTIDYTNATGQYIWAPDASWGPVLPGGGVPLNINLTETNAIVGVADSFKLNFNSGEPYARIPGDVNGDGSVNHVDLEALSSAYGSKPGSPNWNPYCDFNGDDKVDVSDLFDLGRNYGTTVP